MNYKQYYLDQAGGQYSVFRGAARQKGYGLGGMFKSMYRYILPLFKTHALPALKKGAQFIGSEAIKAASNIANDAIRGDDIKNSIKQHSSNAVNTVSNEAQSRLQSGNGRRRKANSQKGGANKRRKANKSNDKSYRRIINTKAHKKTRRISDIFT